MANRTVKVILEGQISGFQGAMKAATKSAKDFRGALDDTLKNKPQEVQEVSTAVGALGAVLTSAAVVGVKKFMDFDAAMSNVASTGADAKNSIGALREAALEAGASTVFSATEAAGAVEELAKAGLGASDILGGALAGSLDLAAAGELSVARAAEVTSMALTLFKLDGGKATHVADLLAAGAGKAAGDVEDLGSALSQSGLVAAQTGLSLEETTGALAAFAQNGLLGSDAGTSFKSMLQRLTPQSKEAKKQFEELGISAYDAQGNFVGLEAFAGNLQDAMKDLTPEARNAAMGVMFGSDAVRAASIIYSEGSEGIRGWIDAVDDQGYAAMTAGTKLDNLKGDFEALGGALETVFIKSGSGSNDALRVLTQSATGLVDIFGSLPDAVHYGLGIIGGSTGVAMLGVAGMVSLIGKVNETKAAFKTLGISGKAAGLAVGGVGAAFAVGALALGAWGKKVAEQKAAADSLYDTLDKASGAHTELTRETMADTLATKEYNDIFGHFGKSANRFAEGLGVSKDALLDAALGSQEAIDKIKELEAAQKKSDPHGNSRVAWEFLWKAIEDGNTAVDGAGLKFEDLQEALGETDQATAETQLSMDELAASFSEAEAELSEYALKWQESILDTSRASHTLLGAFDEVAAKGEVTAKKLLSTLEQNAKDYQNWSKNVVEIQRKLTETLPEHMQAAGVAMVQELADAGPEAAKEAALLAKMTDKELQKAVENSALAGTDAGQAFAENLDAARPAELQVGIAMATTKTAELEKLILDAGGRLNEWVIDADGRKAVNAADKTVLTIDQKTGKITIDGEDSKAKTKIQGVVDAANKAKGVVPIEAHTTYQAYTVLSNFQAAIRKPITIPIQLGPQPKASPYRAGLLRPTFATGGGVHGPGTGTSDSIPALLSNGEHVWTDAETRAAGGHGALERMRALAKAGLLPAFATGGRVGDYEREVSAASRAVSSAKSAVARAKKTKSTKDDKPAANRLTAAEKRLDTARDRLAALRETRAELTSGAATRSYSFNEKTGKVDTSNALMSQGTGGLSGAYSLVDQVRAAAKLPGLTAKQQSAMSKAAGTARGEFEKLYKSAAGLEGKLGKAQGHLAEMASVKANVSGALAGGMRLDDAIKEEKSVGGLRTQKRGVTGGDLVSHAKNYAKKLGSLRDALKKLAGWGLSSVVLREIASYGVDDGLMIANSLTQAQVKELNGSYATIEKYANETGTYSTLNFKTEDGTSISGGINAAAKTVAAVEKQITANDKALANQTDKLLDAWGKPFNLHYDGKTGRLTSIQKKRDGGWIVGPGTGTSDSVPLLGSNGEFMVRAREAQKPANAAMLVAMNAGRKVNPGVATQSVDYNRLGAAVAAAMAASPAQVTSNLVMDRRTLATWLGMAQQAATQLGVRV